MTTDRAEVDLRLQTLKYGIFTVLFTPHSFQLEFAEGDASVKLYEPFEIAWPDGSSELFDPSEGGTNPTSLRLIASLLRARIVESVAGVERAVLKIVFDNGIRFDFSPGDEPYWDCEAWDIKTPEGDTYRTEVDGTLLAWTSTGVMLYPPPGESDTQTPPGQVDAADVREIDLDMNAHLFGVTVYGASVQLETRAGSIYLAGPFTVTDVDGESFVFDPEKLEDDDVAGAILALLIDHVIESAVLKPETSEFTVTLKGGGRLDWKAPTTAQAQFSAKHHNGREFWSKGDGTVYWYGGPEGTHPKFVVGGPRKGE
jgi:hypothetical protein